MAPAGLIPIGCGAGGMSGAHESGFEAKFGREGISSFSAFVATGGLQHEGWSQPIESSIEASRRPAEREHVRLREACRKCKNAPLDS
jgi:hypothetical protein